MKAKRFVWGNKHNMKGALMGQTNSPCGPVIELLWEQEQRLLWGKLASWMLLWSSCNFPGAMAVPAMYFLVTDQFVHAFGPILNLLSAATSTAAAGSRIWEFLVHSVKKCFLLSALTEFAASFCSYNYRIWRITMVRATCSACLLPL